MPSSKTERLLLSLFALATGGVVLLALAVAAAGSVGLIGGVDTAFTGAHWRAILSAPTLWLSLAYSAAIAVLSLLPSVALALLIVLAAGARLRRAPLDALLVLPLAFPGVVAALVAVQVLGGAGWLSRFAHAAGLVAGPEQFPALVHDRLGIGVVITHSLMVTPFFVLLIARMSILERLDDLAALGRSLGATSAQALWSIRVPVLLRGLSPVAAVYGAALLASFEVPLLIGAQHPAMIAVEIDRHLRPLDLATRGQGYAMACVYLLLLSTAWWWLSRRAAKR
ncbi:hypothetical protein [Nevskia sp.]|uniref:hypothetical protein n=1 Tax=Nevskia sp. TaxID=1929292 RepID=UPI0025CE9F52|nr:hypothetical protein [Nevskia sp.]